jgi:hypothetical protein
MKAKTTNRRNFLLAAGVGGVGAAAAIVAGRPKTKVAAAEDTASDKGTSYRATEHVLKYYKTTLV